MTAAERLDALLTALGHPPAPPPDLRRFHYRADLPDYNGEWSLFNPLVRRGWCTHFDAEGQFFAPGAHSALIGAFLTLAGAEPLPTARDTWIKGVGWIFEIEDGQRRLSYHAPEPGRDLPSDYCELWLAKALIEDWLGGSHRLVDPITGDQTAFCCMMPQPVYDAVCGALLLDPEPEELLQPSPDQLVLQGGAGVEDYFAQIVRLEPAQADQMLAEAPRDWLSAPGAS